MLWRTRRHKLCGSRLDPKGSVVHATREQMVSTKQHNTITLFARERYQHRLPYLSTFASQNATRALCDVSDWSDRLHVNVKSTVAKQPCRKRGPMWGPRRGPDPTPGSVVLWTPATKLDLSGRKAKNYRPIYSETYRLSW